MGTQTSSLWVQFALPSNGVKALPTPDGVLYFPTFSSRQPTSISLELAKKCSRPPNIKMVLNRPNQNEYAQNYLQPNTSSIQALCDTSAPLKPYYRVSLSPPKKNYTGCFIISYPPKSVSTFMPPLRGY